ncbi:unnamed protein product [Sphagnum tenellum]
MATIWSKCLPWTWFGYTPSIPPRASPVALEDGGYAPSVPPEVQVSPVPEDVPPLPQTVSYDIQSLGRYDVFLNHRGTDVKHTFVAHLYDALCAAGFHPFLDAKSLIMGAPSGKSMKEALSGAGVHVAIFSKGYVESRHCLDELHDMLESGKLILPVFYGVEVAHLSRPYDGPFAEGLRQHKKRGRHQDVERWETALAKVADFQGFRLAEFNGRIVLAVQRALPARRVLQGPPHRVGLEESLKVVINKLNLMGDSVGVIGVFGMGGIGKTTLVREVYNHFAMEKRFEEQSFLKDVRSTTDPLDLQKQLVYDLLQEDLQSSEGFSYWFDRFMGRKVLIVVDDIDHRRQFNDLIPNIDKLARGSRILVTSRDQNVLSNIMRGDGHLTAMHEVELMTPHDSHQLFNWHAFYNEKASDGFQDLARKVADACCRLLLALEVIGAFLFDKKRPEHRDCWHEASETLRANGDILNQLQISYDGLSSDEARLMFKDIACFLIGKDEQMVMQIFESCISYKGPQVSFHALMDKSLVTLDSNRRIRMHDLLRDMGRNVVTKQSQIEGQRSHLWDPAMAERVLRKNQGTVTVRGLSVAGAKDGAAWKAETYTRMSELHFLILDHCQVKGNFSTWSEELRWLQWWSLPLSELPPTLSLLNLSVLDLTGSKSVTRISPKNSNDEEEPALQLVSYYDENLRFVNNGMGKEVIDEWDANEIRMEATVTKPEECIAIIFSFVAHDQGWSSYDWNHGRYEFGWCSMEARIIRNNEEVFISHLFKLREADDNDQVYFCTLRRQHPFVHALKHGDKICVYARSSYQGWAITVNQGAICVLYSVLGEIHVVENGTIEGDSNVDVKSQGTKEKLTSSLLVNNPESILRNALEWVPVSTTTILNNGLQIVNVPSPS